jgi:hypothetical protein
MPPSHASAQLSSQGETGIKAMLSPNPARCVRVPAEFILLTGDYSYADDHLSGQYQLLAKHACFCCLVFFLPLFSKPTCPATFGRGCFCHAARACAGNNGGEQSWSDTALWSSDQP